MENNEPAMCALISPNFLALMLSRVLIISRMSLKSHDINMADLKVRTNHTGYGRVTLLKQYTFKN